jgi:hypothetical protein
MESIGINKKSEMLFVYAIEHLVKVITAGDERLAELEFQLLANYTAGKNETLGPIMDEIFSHKAQLINKYLEGIKQ